MNHSFLRYTDKTHRKYDPNSKYKKVLKEYYKFVDKRLGEIMKLLDKDTKIIITSDHGMTKMNNRINLTDWLIKEGYMVLKEPVTEKKEFNPRMVDWKRTKVFAIGAYEGQIFVNLKGREPEGIVSFEEYDKLIDELEEKIKKIPGDDGGFLDTKIFKKKDYFRGEYENIAPDMVIYFDNLVYGCNNTLIGNKTLWSPQTAMGSDEAGHSSRGIFIINECKKKGNIGEVNIIDIAPTILNELGIEIPKDMEGKVIG
jgi:predicted AlkP superfamily phosphohydrolase/phosphomutase